MSHRKYLTLLLGVFTVCAILLVPMIDRPGSKLVPFGESPAGVQPPSMNHTNETAASIRVAVSVSDQEFRYWQKAARSFEDDNAGIRVEIVNLPRSDADKQLKQASQIGEPFDVMLLDNNKVADFAVSGYLLPADDILTGTELSDQLEALTAPLKWNGSLWGVPVDSNPVVIAWHSGLLKASGLGTPPSGWSAFTAAVDKLQKDNPALSPVNIELSDPVQLTGWLGAFDGSAPAAAGLQPLSPVSRQQLRFVGAQDKLVSRLDPGVNQAELLRRFKAGELLSAVMLWSDYRSMSEAAQSPLQLGGNPGTIAWLGGRSFVLSAQSGAQAEAKRWIAAMTVPARQLERYAELGMLPARKSAYEREFGMEEEGGPSSKLLTMFGGTPYKPDPEWGTRFNQWSELLSQFAGKPFGPGDAERLIKAWNGIRQNGA